MERDKASVRLQQRLTQSQVEAAEAAGALDAASRRSRHLAAQLDEAQRAADAGHRQLMELQAAHAAVQQQLADARRGAQQAAAAAEASHRQAVSDLEARIGELTDELHAAHADKAALASRHAEASAAAAAAHEKQLKETEGALRREIRDLANTNAQLVAKVFFICVYITLYVCMYIHSLFMCFILYAVRSSMPSYLVLSYRQTHTWFNLDMVWWSLG